MKRCPHLAELVHSVFMCRKQQPEGKRTGIRRFESSIAGTYDRSFNSTRWPQLPLLIAFTMLILKACPTSTEAPLLNYTQHSVDHAIMEAYQSQNVSGLSNDPRVIRVELDMLFSADDWLDMIRNDSNGDSSARRKRRKAKRNLALRWPRAVVPYTIGTSFTNMDFEALREAIADYHNYTCVRFRDARPDDQDYVRITDSFACSSYVGRQGGMQELSLSRHCRRKSVIIHELGHAIGFVHEHSRHDRDKYVLIKKNNIRQSFQDDFVKYNQTIADADGIPYDYLSIMHYGQYAASKNGETVIETKNASYQQLIGQGQGFSFRDIKLVNSIYGCSDRNRCRKKACPGEGFVGQDCRCWCPSSDNKVAAVHCPECEDYEVYCQIFQQRGFCSIRLFRNYMKEICPRSCGNCS